MSTLADHYYPLVRTDCERAIRELCDLIAEDPTRADALEILAHATFRALDLELCIKVGRALLDLNPSHGDARAYVRSSLMLLGRSEEALAYCGDDPLARYMAGILLHPVEALQRFEQALAGYPAGHDQRAPSLFAAMRLCLDMGERGAPTGLPKTSTPWRGSGRWQSPACSCSDTTSRAFTSGPG